MERCLYRTRSFSAAGNPDQHSAEAYIYLGIAGQGMPYPPYGPYWANVSQSTSHTADTHSLPPASIPVSILFQNGGTQTLDYSITLYGHSRADSGYVSNNYYSSTGAG